MAGSEKRPQFILDQGSETPLYLQLADALRRVLREGTYAPGARLPSIRALSDGAAVNPATVVSAYRILEREGAVFARAGSGVYAAELRNDALTELALGRVLVPPGAIDLAAGSPSPELFPVLDFKGLAAEVLERDGGRAFAYREGPGYPPFRESAARYLAETQGFSPESEDLLVVSGAQQGIDLAAKAVLDPRDTVAVERPSYRGALAVFWSRGAATEDIAIDGEGMDLNALEAVAKGGRLRLVYVIPRYQNPTTLCWSEARMRGLLDLAERYGFYVLEDDPVSNLVYGTRPTPPNLKSLDSGDRVIYVRSFSKVLLPGIRLGFVVAPRALRPAMDAAKRATDIATDGLLQRIVDLYLRRGLHRDQERRLVAHFRGVYGAALSALAPLLGRGARLAPPGGGLHLWLELPEGIGGVAAYASALERGCVVVPEAVYGEGADAPDRHLRISFASVDEAGARRGVALLSDALASLGSGDPAVLPLL